MKNLKPELISFNLCPFVQRSVITLLEKKVDFKLTYIDLYDPPEWFKDISPLRKVPVVRVGDVVLFESAVINEYLDEVNPPSMQLDDPLLRAQNRAWIEFGSDMIMNHFNMTIAKDKQSFTNYYNQLTTQFKQLEKTLTVGPYFNASDLSLVDAAFAPLFMRIDLFETRYPLHLYQMDSRVGKWSRALAALDSVKNSVISDFSQVYSDYLQSNDSHYSRLVWPSA